MSTSHTAVDCAGSPSGEWISAKTALRTAAPDAMSGANRETAATASFSVIFEWSFGPSVRLTPALRRVASGTVGTWTTRSCCAASAAVRQKCVRGLPEAGQVACGPDVPQPARISSAPTMSPDCHCIFRNPPSITSHPVPFRFTLALDRASLQYGSQVRLPLCDIVSCAEA